MYMSHISANDLVFYKEEGNVMSGGFKVQSILLNQNISRGGGGGQKQNNAFENLAVPMGLLYQEGGGGYNKKYRIMDDEQNETEKYVLDEDIYDKLLKLVEIPQKQRRNKTRKEKTKNPNPHKITKRIKE